MLHKIVLSISYLFHYSLLLIILNYDAHFFLHFILNEESAFYSYSKKQTYRNVSIVEHRACYQLLLGRFHCYLPIYDVYD